MAAFPTLKRGANDRCAYGAILATFMDFAGPKGSLVLGMTVALGFGVGGNAGPLARSVENHLSLAAISVVPTGLGHLKWPPSPR